MVRVVSEVANLGADRVAKSVPTLLDCNSVGIGPTHTSKPSAVHCTSMMHLPLGWSNGDVVFAVEHGPICGILACSGFRFVDREASLIAFQNDYLRAKYRCCKAWPERLTWVT